MRLRDFVTKRSLKKRNEELKSDIRHLKTELRNERTNVELSKSTLEQCQQENKRLWAIIAALTDKYSDNDEQSGFTCVGVTEVQK